MVLPGAPLEGAALESSGNSSFPLVCPTWTAGAALWWRKRLRSGPPQVHSHLDFCFGVAGVDEEV